MKPLSPDVLTLAEFNANTPSGRAAAVRAFGRLMKRSTNRERAALMAFVRFDRRGLTGYAPAWAYQIVGALLARYPAAEFPDPKIRGARVRGVLRARLQVAAGIRTKGGRLL